METDRVVVDVVNTIGPASAPFNGFAAYRVKQFPRERHVILSYEAVDPAFLRSLDPQLADGNLTVVDCGGSLRRFAKAARLLLRQLHSQTPHVVVHLHHHRSGLLFHLIRPWLDRTPPMVFTVRNSFEDYTPPGKVLAAANFLLADAVTFVSGASYRAFPAVLRRVRGAAACAVPNGVDLDRIDATLATVAGGDGVAPGPGSFRLLYVARFVAQKNHRFLIDLMKELPNEITLTLIGQGVLQEEVSSWVKRAGLGHRVRFTGLIPREAVYREMIRSDAFVSTSRWEGLPVAVLEAMAARLPLVVSDIEPHREIAAIAPSLQLLPLELEAWRSRLAGWAALPKAELKRIGDSNREAVAAELSLVRMHERYSEIYRRIGAPAGRASLGEALS